MASTFGDVVVGGSAIRRASLCSDNLGIALLVLRSQDSRFKNIYIGSSLQADEYFPYRFFGLSFNFPFSLRYTRGLLFRTQNPEYQRNHADFLGKLPWEASPSLNKNISV